MSVTCVSLASILLKEHYGDVVSTVGRFLLDKNSLPIRKIAFETKLKLNEVRKCLCVLIQHGMVDYRMTKNGFLEYTARIEPILAISRYPHYVQCAKTRYGEPAECIVDELLLHGELTVTSVVEKVTGLLNKHITDGSNRIESSFIEEKFDLMVKDKFVYRSPTLRDENKNTSVGERISVTVDSQNDSVFWRVNFDRVHQFMRDKCLISAVETALDDKVSTAIVRSILRMAETQTQEWDEITNSASKYNIERDLKATKDITGTLGHHLQILLNDQRGFIQKCGDEQGGMYLVNYKQSIENLASASIENIILERYGSKHLRLYRLMRTKNYLEQQAMEEMMMCSAKAVKEITYELFQGNLIQPKEISRTADFAASRTIFLFHVDLREVVQMAVEWCYIALMNVINRRHYETDLNKQLLMREQRIDAIVASLVQQGGSEDAIAEYQQHITPPERAELDKLKLTCKELQLAELQLDETLFILHMYLKYHKY